MRIAMLAACLMLAAPAFAEGKLSKEEYDKRLKEIGSQTAPPESPPVVVLGIKAGSSPVVVSLPVEGPAGKGPTKGDKSPSDKR